MSYSKYDEKVARSLQDQLNCTGITENAVFPKEKEKENYRPRTLVDETLEYIDPTPNIYTLFVQFNEKFFWNVLLPVQVKWSPRMTSCAGICTFHPRNRECVVALSTPLLKLRPRKDLIETLLHEMIHAYLFLTNNNRDRDGHGPVFQSHMHRINKAAGTNITIYHTFHDEVKLYQQHWWRCNGPCQKRAPYFGMVRRAMNRAPGPNDRWWTEHMANCGGQFIKIKEPEKAQKKKSESKKQTSTPTATSKSSVNSNGILKWIKKPDSNVGGNATSGMNSKKVDQPQPARKSIGNSTTPIASQTKSWSSTKTNTVSNLSTDLKKLGNSTNNVHGWGTAGPNASTSNSNKKPTTMNGNASNSGKSNYPRLAFSGTVGGSSTGRSNLLDKYSDQSIDQRISIGSQPSTSRSSLGNSSFGDREQKKTVNCPNCQKSVEEALINEHLDKCLEGVSNLGVVEVTSNKKRKSEVEHSSSNKVFKKDDGAGSSSDIECPLCSKKVKADAFNHHLDICTDNIVAEPTEEQAVSLHDSSSSSVNLQDSPHVCLICDKVLEPHVSLNEHLEDCVSSVFNDSNEEDDAVEEIKTDDKTDKIANYPCPVCMALIDEAAMNAHLDSCLK